MALIHAQGKITYNHPAIDGVTTVQGYSRDWRPSKKWELSGAEFIDPLKCLGPVGDLRPVGMGTTWLSPDASYNQAIRSVYLPGNPPALSAEFYDGKVYAAGTAATTYAGYMQTLSEAVYPNFTVRCCRYAPPPAQGITPQTVINLYAQVRIITSDGGSYLDRNGTWTDGMVSFLLPFQSEVYKNPCLAWQPSRSGGYLTTANIFSEGHSSQSLSGGMLEEMWAFEWIEDRDRFDGGHFLIRNSSAPTDWWHSYQENIRLVTGQVGLVMAGCRQQVNVSPIVYSNASGLYGTTTTVAEAWPSEFQPLPTAEYETTATWNKLYSSAGASSDWAGGAEAKDSATVQAEVGYRPKISFTAETASAPTRPVVWLVIEDHEPTIAVPAGLPAAEDTDADGNLYDLTLRVNSEWRGASGSASFYNRDTAQYATWLERGRLTLNFGWQTSPAPGGDLAAADVATMWIKPGGIKRGRSGDTEIGRPGLTIDFADLIEVKLKDTCIVDMGQAGGMTVDSWFGYAAERIGLPAARVSVAAGVASNTIPASRPIPSTPNLAPQDGQSWEGHFDEVCKAAGLRWGYNPFTGLLFIDAGKPTYTAGVSAISFTLDYNTLTVPEVIFDVDHTRRPDNIRNRYKVCWGDEAHRRGTYYKAADTEIAATGQDLWAVADDKDGDAVADIKKELDKAHRTGLATITFTTFLQRALQPDQFVKIGDVPELGLETNSVWQITEVSHSRASVSTELTAVEVYSPGGLI